LFPDYPVAVLAAKRTQLYWGLVPYFCVKFFPIPRFHVVSWISFAEFPRGKYQNHPELGMKLFAPTMKSAFV